jgi:ubiquinone/menaquinone biosynthesis C-methylase UbiE
MERDIKLRTLFDQVADLYDKARPTYPEALFDELIKKIGLSETSQLLEIAPGTGQATLPLAKRGYKIIAVELGEQLSEIAKKNLQNYSNVEIINSAFEDVNLPEKTFDLIYVATAFHWIKPEAQFSKPHQLLKDGGYLAIIKGDQISNNAGDVFFHASQPIYEKYWPNEKGRYHLRTLTEVKPTIFDDKLFQLLNFKCFPQIITSSADAYCELLNTDSEKLALSPERREIFINEIRQLINERFNGIVEKRYANSLLILKKQ